METHIKRSTCLFHNSRRPRHDESDGVVLLIVMIVATLLLIGLTAALPRVYQEGQREREEELIFRGSQYGKAVALFHQKFGRYPTNIKELLGTNGMRFLRQEYRDPMDPNGKWRYIHVSATGVLLDSKNQPTNNQNPGLNPNSQNPGLNPNSQNPALNQNSSTGSMFSGNSPSGGSSFGSSSFGSSSFGNSSMQGANGFGSPSGPGGPGGPGGMMANSNPAASGQTSSSSSFFGDQNMSGGTYIAGVAATTHHTSIKVWQKHTHYDEWEFLGIDMGIFGIQVGSVGPGAGASPMGQQPLQPDSGLNQAGPFGATNPPTNFGFPTN